MGPRGDFCEVCKTISHKVNARGAGYGPHHLTASSFQTAVLNECPICIRLWRILREDTDLDMYKLLKGSLTIKYYMDHILRFGLNITGYNDAAEKEYYYTLKMVPVTNGCKFWNLILVLLKRCRSFVLVQ